MFLKLVTSWVVDIIEWVALLLHLLRLRIPCFLLCSPHLRKLGTHRNSIAIITKLPRCLTHCPRQCWVWPQSADRQVAGAIMLKMNTLWYQLASMSLSTEHETQIKSLSSHVHAFLFASQPNTCCNMLADTIPIQRHRDIVIIPKFELFCCPIHYRIDMSSL